MAGTPSFSRAKRFRFFHTSHQSVFNGSEIKHVKSDYTASVDGAHDIKAKSANIARLKKETISHSDLTVASTDQKKYLFSAAAGDVINDVFANVGRGFGYGATASLIKLQIGVKTDLDAFAKNHLCGTSDTGIIMEGQTGLTDKGTYLWNASGTKVPYVFSAAASVMCKFTSSGDTVFMASLDKGSVDIYFNMLSLPQ